MNKPECPYCHYEFDDWYKLMTIFMSLETPTLGGSAYSGPIEIEIPCPSCEMKFYIEKIIKVEYNTYVNTKRPVTEYCQNYAYRGSRGLTLTETDGEFGKGDMCERKPSKVLYGFHLCNKCFDFWNGDSSKNVGNWC